MRLTIRYDSFAQVSYQAITTFKFTVYFKTAQLSNPTFTKNSRLTNTPTVNPNYTYNVPLGYDTGISVLYVSAGSGFAGGGDSINVNVGYVDFDLDARTIYETPVVAIGISLVNVGTRNILPAEGKFMIDDFVFFWRPCCYI